MRRNRRVFNWVVGLLAVAIAAFLFVGLQFPDTLPGRVLRGAAIIINTPTPTPTLSLATPVSAPLIAELSVQSETQANGEIKRSSRLSVEPLGWGNLELTSPSAIDFGESLPVRLVITPDSALAEMLPVSVNVESAEDPSYGIPINDRIQVYPIMIAELQSIAFEITPSGPQKKIVTSQSPVVWSWIITPKKPLASKNYIGLAISIPVLIDQTDEEFSHLLKEIEIPIQVQVTPAPAPSETPTPTPTPTPMPVTRQIGRQLVDNFAIILIALISLVGTLAGVYASIQNSKRENNISILEKELENLEAKEAKQKIETEIARLRAIKWWQFWHR